MRQFRDTPYYVDEEGTVWRHWKRKVVRYSYTDIVSEEKWKPLKPQTVAGGYKMITLYFGNGKVDKQPILLHRMVAELYVPGYFEGAHVDHIDCNNQNNHPSNLQWCTKEYNSKKKNNPNYPLFQI